MTITLPLSLQVSSLPDDACTFWNAALVSLVITFTVGPQHSLILLFSTVSFRVLQHLFASLLYSFFFVLSFWRGTNPFATVKLKPTATDDRSSPRFHRQWHLNPETNAFVECDSSSLTLKIVVWLMKWTFGGGCFVFYCPSAHKYEERGQNVLINIVFVAFFMIRSGFVICKRVRINHKCVYVTN